VWFIAKRDAEKAMEGVNGKMIKKAGAGGKAKVKGDPEGRVVAVDWALSKDKWAETQKGEGDGEKEAESGSSNGSGSGSESGSSSGSSSDSSEDEDEEEDEEMDVDEEEPVRPTLPTVDVGSTLFIRNLPFEVEEHELNTL
jgi:nucleolar protein 4